MRTRMRQCLGVVAIVAIALHGILLSLAPLAAATADPFSVICHSSVQPPAGQAGDEQAPAGSGGAMHGCDHCNLCSAAPAPAPLAPVLAGLLLPTRALDILRPAALVAVAHLTASPKLAQGPPLSA